ncbi:uncharacterized protein LOC115749956 isoform X2 [Rhodamnia argentea]|uniref:Uncharacterized protein LOC115749956 isoform X2 n=1 Tax=Rhodamnia argentea TaxID=178133 RepID=A0A8B8Q8N2_9MYRT|nr:uncharacterized protein LOC115749956 isoform X2 [Rhodamnia argentea]
MEEGKAKFAAVTDPVPKLDSASSLRSSGPPVKRSKPPSLVSLCVGVVGKHLEDIITDLEEIAVTFPADIKMAVAAIARRRRLLDNNVIVSLADGSWEILDISGSNVSDVGLIKLAGICRSLRAVDISRCANITVAGVSGVLQHCHSLETLRCGGCPRSDYTARCCLGILKPKLHDVDGDSWEELDAAEIIDGAHSLRWLVWPRIDKNTLEDFSAECPRITVNPKPSPFTQRWTQAPREAWPDVILDETFVKDIDPETWAVSGLRPRRISAPLSSPTSELSVAEKFRLAFLERDNRLAPKRAKNVRQRQRRAEKELMTMDTRAKALALASKLSRSLNNRH